MEGLIFGIYGIHHNYITKFLKLSCPSVIGQYASCL